MFLIFLANVVLGAFANAAFMGDVAEMIVLFLTSITFVSGILKAEARRNADE
ncbi:hypothetical protein [Nioella sediminis]|uniref:hypothetical protein n=1 Tax=Nioella sediminis TaxID=1912092 RepID=UPI003184651B